MNRVSSSSLRQISKNSLFLLIARAIDFLAQIAIIPIIARYLEADRYGNYGYVMVFAFISISFTYMGIERITMREIARDPAHVGQYLAGGIIVRWIYMAVAVAVLIVIISFMDLSSEIILAIFVATLALNFAADTSIYLAMFKAFDKMRYEALLALIFQILNLTFVFLVSYFRLGFVALFVGLLTANIIRYISAMVIARKKFVLPHFKESLPIIKLLLKESYVLGLASLLVHGFVNVDIIILKALKDTVEVSMFYAPHNLFLLINVIPISLMSGFFPSLSRSAGTEPQMLVYKYEKAFKVFVIISIFLSTMFIVFAHKIILILFGQEFLKAVPVFQILAVSLIFTMLFSVIDFTLVAIKKQNVLIVCFLSGLIIRGILDLVLIPTYGYMGASIAALIGYFVIFTVGFLMLSRYVTFLPLHRIVLKPVFVAGVIGACLYQFNRGNICFIVLMSLISLGLYMICLLRLKLFLPDEVDFLKRAARRVAGTIFKKGLTVS